MSEFIERLRRDPEPTVLALAMVEAVQQHVIDLIEDDPGDDPRREARLLRDARSHADSLGRVLRTMTGGR
jgi:hypothetical protein